MLAIRRKCSRLFSSIIVSPAPVRNAQIIICDPGLGLRWRFVTEQIGDPSGRAWWEIGSLLLPPINREFVGIRRLCCLRWFRHRDGLIHNNRFRGQSNRISGLEQFQRRGPRCVGARWFYKDIRSCRACGLHLVCIHRRGFNGLLLLRFFESRKHVDSLLKLARRHYARIPQIVWDWRGRRERACPSLCH